MKKIYTSLPQDMRENIAKCMFISDIHVGHYAGTTPPEWWLSLKNKNPRKHGFAILQRKMWNWYINTVKNIGPVDYLIINGDSVEGNGSRTGGTELITTDRAEQVRMAVAVINKVEVNKGIFMFHGSAGHVGCEEDWEEFVADKLGCPIFEKKHLDIKGVVFDIRHHCSGSGKNNARNTALLNQFILNNEEYAAGTARLADIIIRSHRHFYTDVSGPRPNTRAFNTPGLQGPGSKYARKLDGYMPDVGFLTIEIGEDKSWNYNTHLMPYDMVGESLKVE